VLRWVVGSCRAYLKEAKPGEGVLNSMANALYANTYGSYGSNVTASAVRQFTFVVGSPEQETNFKKEIETAQSTHENCKAYPTILAFHGSAAERWHNILRLGLNFDEMANGRVSRGLDPLSPVIRRWGLLRSRRRDVDGHICPRQHGRAAER
jgi:ubiquitin-conjugating enzyme E2 Q